MKFYIRVLKYLSPETHQIVLTIVVSLLTSLFSVVSIYMILPLLNTVFNNNTEQVQTAQSAEKASPPVHKPRATSVQNIIGNIDIDSYKEELKHAFENLIQAETKQKTLLNICIFLIVVFSLKNFFLYLNNQLIIRVQTKTAKKLRDEVFKKIIHMPLSYFHEHKVGTLMNYVHHEVTVVHDAVSSSFVNLIRNPLMVFFIVVVLVIISWKLTLFALIISIASLISIRFIGKKIKSYASMIQSRMGNLNSKLQEVFNGIKLIKANSMENYEVDRFTDFTNEFRRISLKSNQLKGITGPLNETFGVAAIAIALWFGGIQVFSGEMSSVELIVFAFALFSVMQPVKAISQAYTKIQEGLGSAKRIFKIIDAESDLKNGMREIESFTDSIKLENIWFSYHKTENSEVLRDVSLEIKKGETVALVGSSGSGKSTLVDLILRFYDVDKGRILVDGYDIKDYDLNSLRKMFGVVTQEVILFNDSIAGNIAYGTGKNASAEEIVEAAKIANAHEFIEKAAQKFDTNIGDRGLRLSGGQRQRLSIARAMLKNPPILIFDEATSALDNESEKLVQDAINNAMRDRTAIVIAHRLSTIKSADKIVVMDKGKVVEVGSHFELLERNGIYKKLYNMQFLTPGDESPSFHKLENN
ncbi:ABC transporter-related protein [Chloroherpeton thalassium ATCC 35110]|uniref:ABC transporter-related protein n=1 Tax=Chloroherpeton thalassium (strain ATCC 35110 / GB-78) TaxID=517418 RepID=B3QXL5_CHLT3|nr:ABC transporter ATP-binding protein [Chloroherpeton thalassium]ACF14930.1 ABC transporter-related protein [Chloroherpeton thalassium ATCC 35110]